MTSIKLTIAFYHILEYFIISLSDFHILQRLGGDMNAQLNYDFGILYARPSFLTGFISILDWAGALNVYNESPTAEIADLVATKNDWSFVGKDIRSAMNELRETVDG